VSIERAARRTFKVVADRIDRRNLYPGHTMQYTREPGHFTDIYFTWRRIAEANLTEPEQRALLAHMQDSTVRHGLGTAEEMSAIRTRYNIPSVT
jgi:hypothetical protein